MTRGPRRGPASLPAFRSRWSKATLGAAGQRARLVLDRTAVRFGHCMNDRLALHDIQHGLFEIGLGLSDVADPRRSDAVDAGHVLERAILVDDEHMRRGLC